MIINNAINSPFPTILSKGGLNANLTASNGGIFYSTASAGAILSGTSTANQTILSGSSTTPAWSTATYPATTTINQLLYSSSTNVIGGLATANSACLVSDYISFPVVIPYPIWSLPMQDGQIVIGGTSGRPEPFNLTAGNNITILNRPGAVSINSTAVAGNWEFIDSQTAFSTFSNTAQTSIDFDNQLTLGFKSYRLIVKNIIPHQDYTISNNCNLSLRFGTGSGTYVDSNNYHYQICSIQGNGASNIYLGRNNDNQSLLTYPNASGGISNDASFGGVSGIIDLFIRPDISQVANGISKMSYMSNTDGTLEYVNVTSTFQLDISDFYSSVQLFLDREIPIIAGSVSLYGLNTLSDGSENFQWITTQSANSYLNFLNVGKSKYIAYRIMVINVLPTNNGINLFLRFGNADPMIVSDNDYIYQQCCITDAGINNFYHGYNGAGVAQAFLTLTNIHGISPDPSYGGISGTIDLFITSGSSQVANGIARFRYIASDGISQYINTTSTFQIFVPDNYISIQLFMEGVDLMASGSSYLYGLTTLE